jgi:hypothetical protein
MMSGTSITGAMLDRGLADRIREVAKPIGITDPRASTTSKLILKLSFGCVHDLFGLVLPHKTVVNMIMFI